MDQMISSFQVAKPGVFVLGGGTWDKPQWRLFRLAPEKLPAAGGKQPDPKGVFLRFLVNRDGLATFIIPVLRP